MVADSDPAGVPSATTSPRTRVILWLPTSAHPRLRRAAWHHHRGLARAAGPRGRYFLERQAREKLNKHAKAGKAWPGRYLPLAAPSELELVPSPRYLAVRAMTAASLACRPPTDQRPLPGRDANRCFRAGWFREPNRDGTLTAPSVSAAGEGGPGAPATTSAEFSSCYACCRVIIRNRRPTETVMG